MAPGSTGAGTGPIAAGGLRPGTERRPTASLGGVRVGGRAPVALMGVINVSPESFYAGSVHLTDGDIHRAALALAGAGAAVIDVGAMSTAPYGRGPLPEPEEASRLAHAVRIVRAVGMPVSADTARPGPARAALDAGATIVNDVSGLADPEVARVAAARGASVILMASPAAARAAGVVVDAEDPLGTTAACLAASLARAQDAGIAADRIVLDPGIGFFLEEREARAAWDTGVLAGLGRLLALGRPLAVGVSRKSFVGALTGRTRPDDRLPGSLAATALAVAAGAAVIRAHDAVETVDAIRVAERIAAAAPAGRGRRGGPASALPRPRGAARR